MDFITIEGTFVDIGGQFISSAFDMQKKLGSVKAYLFDWDGVFNSGRKGKNMHSGFSEVDSLGVSMLRFGHFLRTGEIPLIGVISGQENHSAVLWARRENINAVYMAASEKQKALEVLTKSNGIRPAEICYFYDDILDVPIAQKAGLRLAVGRLCNPLFLRYLEENHLADYISSCSGDEHAVREFCELLLMLLELYEEVVNERAEFSKSYKTFLKKRQLITPSFYKYSNGVISTTREYDKIA